jgi:type VI secretion system protein ImpK
MAAPQGEDAFVLQCFREFYGQVIRLRRGVLANPWGIAAEGSSPERDDQLRQAAAQRLSDLLLVTLERQAMEAGRRQGEYGAAFFREALYVMATLADEVFLQLEWQGQPAWMANLLETRLFGTHVGGEELFRRLDVILREQDAVKRPLAAVYLMALSLGFQGRWRGIDAADLLADYRRRTFAFVFPGHRSVARGERRLFPDAYESTVTAGSPVRRPRARRWVIGAAAAFLVYLGVTDRVFVAHTARSRAFADSVEAASFRANVTVRDADRLQVAMDSASTPWTARYTGRRP